MDKRYFETVQLLLDVAPLIFQGGDFAMKGGTAINLFHRDMPRLSVDIDVVYIHENRMREEALGAISQALDQAATELERRGLAVRRQASTGKATTGSDGRFDWPRKEFEKALRERDRYELWRVYRIADKSPVAKCVPNPAKMLGARQILLELGLLRAKIEDIS